MAVPGLLTAAARTSADSREATSASPRAKHLLFFRGSLHFGDTRAHLQVLNRHKDVVFDASGGKGKHVTKTKFGTSSSYADDMLDSVFCLSPKGHTCESRRFFDAIAAGCIPIIVNCEQNSFPFETSIDYSSFLLYYPMKDIERDPDSFVICLRQLRDSPHMSTWRAGLARARAALNWQIGNF